MKFKYKSLFDLSGKTAIVTGGTGILGRHFCRGLAEFGANVAVVDIEGQRAKEIAGELSRDYGVKTAGIKCDVSNPKSVRNMVRKTVEIFGGIDILHNNAASKSDDLSAFFAPFEKYTLNEWRRVMAVNIDGMFLVAQAVGDQMVRQGSGGRIIQTASIYGIIGSTEYTKGRLIWEGRSTIREFIQLRKRLW